MDKDNAKILLFLHICKYLSEKKRKYTDKKCIFLSKCAMLNDFRLQMSKKSCIFAPKIKILTIMATALAKAAPRQTFLISFDPGSRQAVQLMSALKLMDFLSVEESPYDPRYVAEVKAMDKRTFKTVNRNKLWD